MLFAYSVSNQTLQRQEGLLDGQAYPWIDLIDPTVDEDRAVEARLGISIPTREDMQEIELSSRLYVEGARVI